VLDLNRILSIAGAQRRRSPRSIAANSASAAFNLSSSSFIAS
jgi:hypothetical protein